MSDEDFEDMKAAQVVFEASDGEFLREMLDRIDEADGAYLQDMRTYY